MLDRLGADDLALELKDLLALEAVADRTLIEGAFDAIVEMGLSSLNRLTKLRKRVSPAMNGHHTDFEERC